MRYWEIVEAYPFIPFANPTPGTRKPKKPAKQPKTKDKTEHDKKLKQWSDEVEKDREEAFKKAADKD